MDPLTEFGPMVRNDVGQEVAFQQDRLTRAAIARGDLTEGSISRAIQVGNTRRSVPSYDNIRLWPWPPYATVTTSQASTVDLRAAAEEGIRIFQRTAPRSGNKPKPNNRYRYGDSLRVVIDGRLFQSLPPATVMTTATTIALVDIAAHASPVEIRKPVMEGIARALTAEFPQLSISFGWTNSDTFGLTYGKGTGGPVGKQVVYALPLITIAATGFARIARRRDGPRVRGKGRR
ncbi:hypothetical protein RM190_00565 [Paracoccus sp. CPCC 101403]|uniref:DUF3394 domain-containing protein n=1 Tax=Paracoccus broussonetiae TaxID=3075834 RepID=A0ABU3E839_9RHOB|nr:hypothetical protein [Paracoccus sp. CPCC 101403]MDT1060325.1 hypothetical protein [Paracoccus sp. CPCC 101403]